MLMRIMYSRLAFGFVITESRHKVGRVVIIKTFQDTTIKKKHLSFDKVRNGIKNKDVKTVLLNWSILEYCLHL